MPTNRPKVTRVTDHTDRLWIEFDTGYVDTAHPLDTYRVHGNPIEAVLLSIGHVVQGTDGPLTITSIDLVTGE